jgi:hypothetical protein
MAELPDYYEILQVHPKAEPEVIEAAYRRLVRLYHPDVSRLPDAEERMREINVAYEVLSDPQRRHAYDAARNGRAREPARDGAPSSPQHALPIEIEVQPRVLSFGQVTPGEPARATVRVRVRSARPWRGRAVAGPDWLHVEPAAFNASPAELRVTASTVGLRPQSAYQGRVVIEIDTARHEVPVSLVLGDRLPVLNVRPLLLALPAVATGEEAMATVEVENTGGGQLHGEARSTVPWLTVQPALFTSNAVTLVLRASAAQLLPGRSYEGRVHVRTNGGEAWITVDFPVADPSRQDTPPCEARSPLQPPVSAALRRIWAHMAPRRRALVLAGLGLAMLAGALVPAALDTRQAGAPARHAASSQPVLRATLAPVQTPSPSGSPAQAAAAALHISSVRGALWRIELQSVEREARLGRWNALGTFLIVSLRYSHLSGPDDTLPALRLVDALERSYTPSQSVTHDYVTAYRMAPPAGLLSAGQRVDTALVFDVDPQAGPYRLEAPDGLRYRTLPLP